MQHVLQRRTRILAPLVGGSDLSFRLLARKYGAEVTFTEMCVAEYWLNENKKYVKKYTFEFDERDHPLIMQLAGNSPDPIVQMANLPLFRGKVDALDLNCGCPQNFALRKGYGSALMRDVDHLTKMCEAIVRNVPFPVSVKMRLHEDVDTTVKITQRLYDVGVKAFTIHGRYYWQRGSKRGIADWGAIKKIKESLPRDAVLIGNGNIGSFADFDQMIKETGVDAAMAGYGALIRPFVFQETPVDLSTCISDYLSIARRKSNSFISILRHLEWMLKNYRLTPLQSFQMFQSKNLDELKEFLSSLQPAIKVVLENIPKEEERITYPPLRVMSDHERRKIEDRLREKSARDDLDDEDNEDVCG